MHITIDKWPYKWITGFIVLLVGAITIFITGRGPLSGSFFVPKKSTSMKSSNSMPAENSTVCECSFSNQKHRLNHSSSFYKDGPLVINAVMGPLQMAENKWVSLVIFHPCKWSKWRFSDKELPRLRTSQSSGFQLTCTSLGARNNTWKAAWSRAWGPKNPTSSVQGDFSKKISKLEGNTKLNPQGLDHVGSKALHLNCLTSKFLFPVFGSGSKL